MNAPALIPGQRTPDYVDQAHGWHDATRYLPENPRCVLAHDNEAHFIAVHENDLWYNAHLDEPIDSVIIGWQELPEIPDGL